jgi:Family of unknown function (DUF5999)
VRQVTRSNGGASWGFEREMCMHEPQCPTSTAIDGEAAAVVAGHPEQGWSLLCNGIVLFEDTGELLPDGHAVAARRREMTAASPHRAA